MYTTIKTVTEAPIKAIEAVVLVKEGITSNQIMKQFNINLAVYLLVCLIYLYMLHYVLQRYLNDKFKIRRVSYEELVTKTLISAIAISFFMAIFPIFSYHLSIPLASIGAIAYIKYN